MSATPPRTKGPIPLKHVSIFAADYQLPYTGKPEALCCTHAIGSKRCKNIRIVDHNKDQTTIAERLEIDQLLPALLQNRCKLGLDIFEMMERWVSANLCLSHNCAANVRPIQYEKLGELGWSQPEIETRAGKVDV